MLEYFTSGLIPQLLVNGILFGTMYGIAAIGLSLIFGTMGIIFLAQGIIIVVMAYLCFYLFTYFHLFLECIWSEIPQRGMAPFAVVKHLDIFNHVFISREKFLFFLGLTYRGCPLFSYHISCLHDGFGGQSSFEERKLLQLAVLQQ